METETETEPIAKKKKKKGGGRPKLEDGRVETIRVRATGGEIEDLVHRAVASGMKYPAYLRSLLFPVDLVELDGEPFTARQWRNRYRKLMAANAVLQAENAELRADAERNA